MPTSWRDIQRRSAAGMTGTAAASALEGGPTDRRHADRDDVGVGMPDPGRAIAVGMPFPKGTGFAMTALLAAFHRAAALAAPDAKVVTLYGTGAGHLLDAACEYAFDWKSRRPADHAALAHFLTGHRVRAVIGLDIGPRAPWLPAARRAGARTIVSYWGAPMSGLNGGLRLLANRFDVLLARECPEHFIFESEAMRALAVRGRGIPAQRTSVVPTGVDASCFSPARCQDEYLARVLGVPPDRTVVVYSGHFEPRKGVESLMRAARVLRDERGRTDFHMVLAGNRLGEELPYAKLLAGSPAAEHVTFAGYRSDLPVVFASAHVGCLPSTGWDSFPLSALEMQASGLPLAVSDLQGVPETVAPGRTGLVFPAGDAHRLADTLAWLLDHPAERATMGRAARRRIEGGFTLAHQHQRLASVVEQVMRRGASAWNRLGPRGAVLTEGPRVA